MFGDEPRKFKISSFPKGIVWEQTNRENLTIIESEAFRVMRSISDSFKNENTKKEEKSFDFSSVVDQTLRISNLAFIVGLLQLQSFIDKLDRENGIYLPINE